MMIRKFSELLLDSSWRVSFDGHIYNHDDLAACLLNNLEQWSDQGILFSKEKYIVCVGFNSLHYFVYTLFASLLDLKIIYSAANQLETLQNDYPGIEVQCVIAPRSIHCAGKLLVTININNFEYTGARSLSDYSGNPAEQAKIVFCTSGTTGKSKLVQYKESNLINNADVVGNYFGFGVTDVCLCIFPTNYMYGFSMLISMLIKGGTVILERSTIAPARVVEYLNGGQITVLPVLRDLVDKIFPYISASKKYFSRLMVINAADKIYKKQAEKILTFSPVFWNNFGQTESGPRLFSIRLTAEMNLHNYCYRDVVAIGYPVHRDIEVRVKNESHNECSGGLIGDLYYRTKYGMEGYLLAGGELASVHEWQCSGDIVYKNNDGLVYWVGRKSQSIKVNGIFVNVSLLHHSFDAMEGIEYSYFLYDEDSNQIYGYFVLNRKADKKTMHYAVVEQFRKDFNHYPRLSQVHFIEQLPNTGTGKIDIQFLKKLAIAC